jgi:hypothetical protein
MHKEREKVVVVLSIVIRSGITVRVVDYEKTTAFTLF